MHCAILFHVAYAKFCQASCLVAWFRYSFMFHSQLFSIPVSCEIRSVWACEEDLEEAGMGGMDEVWLENV